MSIFGKILSKIFPGNHPAVASTAPQVTPQATPSAAGTTAGQPGTPAASAPAPAPAPAQASATATASAPVDVEAVLTGLAAKNPGPANWRTSIVDLMKLLDLDSSLTARKELAHELGYTGDTNDSASMNIWLHKQVMSKLAANGGKVPAELRD